MKTVTNPILRGFNPDPSIIRVGDDFYIATSTFEWFPGVQIHHSKDLKHWQLIARPLNRLSQLDMKGVPDSCGVWAPCLSYDRGIFYLVYSKVKSFDGVWKDTPNYLVTTSDIRGDWSEPVFLNASGFDASLFHEKDGKKWITNMLSDHRKGRFFGGIVLQELDIHTHQLHGPVHLIFEGTELGVTEAPHLYQRDHYFYLVAAEGGTEYGHAVTVARSKDLTGPYEVHPANPLLTCAHEPTHGIQKSGHADFFETQSGDTYMVFLIGRPLSPLGRCTLGRETAIEKLIWREDNWPHLETGGNLPRMEVTLPNLPPHSFPKENPTDHFDSESLTIHFQSLRIPITEDWCSLTARPGFCRLYGKDSLSSTHTQSLLARRLQSFDAEVSTCLEFSPETFQQMAGLVCYYNTGHYHYCHLMGSGDGTSTFLQIISCDNFRTAEALATPVNLTGISRIYLKAIFHRNRLQFYFASQKGKWQPIGNELDASILSDDYVREGSERYRPAFTGTFVGICCQDLSGNNHHADFDEFHYQELS